MKKSQANMIYNVEWEIGSHMSFSKCICPTIAQAIHHGMQSTQFFMGNPKSAWNRQQISEQDIADTKILLARFPMNIFSHYPYCANLAGQAKKDGLAWNGNSEVDGKLRGAIKSIEYELSILSQLCHFGRRTGVVIHPGSYPDRKLGHEAVAKTLNNIKFAENSILLLENCAGEGNKLCRTFAEIRSIFNLLDENIKPHVKVCVDTAHIWGQGDYDLQTIEGIDSMFDDFKNILGIDNFYLLHLNDSEVPFGAKKDIHACIGAGYIWKNGVDSLVHLLNKCQMYSIPMVLETTPGDMITISQLVDTKLIQN